MEKLLLELAENMKNGSFLNERLQYYIELERKVQKFVDKYGHGVKSDREDYCTLVTCSDIHELKKFIKQEVRVWRF